MNRLPVHPFTCLNNSHGLLFVVRCAILSFLSMNINEKEGIFQKQNGKEFFKKWKRRRE
jgi:hypothetical protein